jgi:FlaG/FlaF family flagellin (archaellin)
MLGISKALKNDDVAVSAVIGTILMIAATVILGGVIYAAVSGFGSKETTSKADVVFKASPYDKDGDQTFDAIKITYLTGPALQDPAIVVADAESGAAIAGAECGAPAPVAPATTATWAPGNFEIFYKTGDCTTTFTDLDAGLYQVVITVAGNVVLDQKITI